MTDDELAAIKARCDSATPGPWENGATISGEREDGLVMEWHPQYYKYVDDESYYHEQGNADALFIAHSRSDIPALLAHIEAQAERIKGLEMRVQKESEERRLRV